MRNKINLRFIVKLIKCTMLLMLSHQAFGEGASKRRIEFPEGEGNMLQDKKPTTSPTNSPANSSSTNTSESVNAGDKSDAEKEDEEKMSISSVNLYLTTLIEKQDKKIIDLENTCDALKKYKHMVKSCSNMDCKGCT